MDSEITNQLAAFLILISDNLEAYVPYEKSALFNMTKNSFLGNDQSQEFRHCLSDIVQFFDKFMNVILTH